jgi:hypothetical protein
LLRVTKLPAARFSTQPPRTRRTALLNAMLPADTRPETREEEDTMTMLKSSCLQAVDSLSTWPGIFARQSLQNPKIKTVRQIIILRFCNAPPTDCGMVQEHRHYRGKDEEEPAGSVLRHKGRSIVLR